MLTLTKAYLVITIYLVSSNGLVKTDNWVDIEFDNMLDCLEAKKNRVESMKINTSKVQSYRTDVRISCVEGR